MCGSAIPKLVLALVPASEWCCHGILSEQKSQTILNGAATMWERYSEAINESGRAIRIHQDYTKSPLNVSQIFELHCHIVTAPFIRVSVEF